MSTPSLRDIASQDINHNAEAQGRYWQAYCAVAHTLDTGDIIRDLCELIAGDSTEHPLAQLIEDWLHVPEPDWTHPGLRPSVCESIGRYVACLAAAVIENLTGHADVQTKALYDRRGERAKQAAMPRLPFPTL
jgi:hypothetical protein